jgi:pyrroloquinoline quinone biosynthesis protein B
MRIRLLGTAAGGGVPQWNCNCRICHEARSRTDRVRARTQSSVAISADEKNWFLLNASPDLRAQIEASPPLHPPTDKTRGSPIQAVLLTNADLDHTLGVFLLREGEEINIHASAIVRESLQQGLCLANVLSAFCGVTWVHPPLEFSPLPNRDGSESGLVYRMIPLGGEPPRFFKRNSADPNHVNAYQFVDKRTRGRLLYLPDMPAINEEVKRLLSDCDILLLDGTFWSENEMQQCGTGTISASQMGHIPISGPTGSLVLLKHLDVKAKIYVHINNTNPILLEGSEEKSAVEASGCIVGEDGMELMV